MKIDASAFAVARKIFVLCQKIGNPKKKWIMELIMNDIKRRKWVVVDLKTGIHGNKQWTTASRDKHQIFLNEETGGR